MLVGGFARKFEELDWVNGHSLHPIEDGFLEESFLKAVVLKNAEDRIVTCAQREYQGDAEVFLGADYDMIHVVEAPFGRGKRLSFSHENRIRRKAIESKRALDTGEEVMEREQAFKKVALDDRTARRIAAIDYQPEFTV